MKKIILFASALAGLFLAGSCQRENLEPMESANTVTYTVQLSDAVGTKALGDDINAVNELVYEVWRTKEEETKTFTNEDNLLYHKTAPITNGVATIELEFVNNQHFTVLFWAHTKDNGVYDVDDLRCVTIESTDAANNVNAQAFVGRDFVRNCVSDANGKVTLVRPVSQLNIATTPESLVFEAEAEADEKGSKITLNGSSVKVSGLATSYNIGTLSAFGAPATEYEYTMTAVPADDLTVNGKPYTYVAMNYIGFAPEMGTSDVTVSYEINTTEGNIANTIENVPVKPNYRTNIIGNLITSKTDYTIELLSTWGTPEEVVECWNGSEVNIPKQSATDPNIYEIEFPSELAWLAAAVNGTLPVTKANLPAESYAGKTFVLTEDIDLGGHEWIPIGSSANPFQGTFDGNGKTVKNLVITGNNSNVGLFGNTNSGEIKNLTVENAKVSGRLNVGVVAGQPYTSKYTNITVTGHVEVNGMAYVGAVGGKNAYADWTNVKVEVDETSYVKANSVENGTAYRTYVGGVVGFNGEGGHSFTNITSNINVEGSTCDVGGLFGIAHYGNQFENCSCSGNVTITTDEVENALEMGGIAGVWNNGGQDVVFTNCTFEGELLTPNITEEFDFYYGGLIGNPYSPDGKGKLIIDGATCVHDAASLKAALEANTENIVVGANIQTTEGFTATGENITLNLGGYTISGTDNSTGSFGLITNKGKLTVKGLGSMTLTATNDREWNAYSSVISNSVGGNLTVDGGVVIEHFGGTAMAYGIDNLTNGKGTSAVTTIKNATVKSVYRAVRQFLNGIEATNELYVEAGAIIESVAKEDGSRNKSIWMQDPSANANTGKLVVAEGAQLKGDVYLYVCAGSTEWPVEVSIANAAFAEGSTVITGNVPAGVAVENVDGVWTLVKTYEEIKEGDTVTGYKVKSADGFKAVAAKIAETPTLDIVLDADIDLTNVEKFGDETTLTPIGSTGERDTRGRLVCEAYQGTFDGQGHTIKGIVQNGWDMGYEWGQYGSLGLFAELEDATVKNLTIEAMDACVEGGDISFIAGSATGNCVFENITIKSSSIGTYNNGCGGIIGWSGAGTYTFKDITLDSDVVLGGLWGSFDSSIGGIVGQAEPGATYNFENVTINCRIDAYNDVTAAYKYYCYRMCGMIIGRCEETVTIDGSNYPDLSKYTLSFKNVEVNFGEWMNYHYCVVEGKTAWRVEPGYAYGGIPADHDHSTCALHCNLYKPFDVLIGGAQYGVYGHRTLDNPEVKVTYPASYDPNH